MANDWMWPYFTAIEEGCIGFILRAARRREARKELVDWRLGTVETDPDLSSDLNFSTVRDWYFTCLAEHKECSKTMGKFIPTRLIDVGFDSLHDPRLIITSQSTKEADICSYLALSHCWGGEIDFKATAKRLESTLAGMSCEEMPKNFKDAVEITRKLGFRYLWIDSCIIQDSEVDWEKEAARMGEVYTNAAITIAASVSKNSNEGILKHVESQVPLFEIPFDDDAAPENALTVYPKIQKMQRANDEEDFVKMVSSENAGSIFASRGWTFQERLLSRRMVHYGTKKIFWSCCESQMAGDEADCETWESIYIRGISFESQPALQLYDEWYKWLSDYTEFRQLTKPSDKLPALSGIASYLSKLTGDKYLAGLWLGDLCRGFIWQRTPWVPYKRVDPPRGPSWSWVNFDCGVQFLGKDQKVSEQRFKVIGYSVQVKGANPFGEVLSAKLVLEALVLELDKSQRGSLRRTKPGFLETIWDYKDISEESGIWDPKEREAPEPINANMFGIQLPPMQLRPTPKPPKDVVQALILSKVTGQPDVYQRIGQVVLDNIDETYLEGEEDSDAQFELRRLTLI